MRRAIFRPPVIATIASAVVGLILFPGALAAEAVGTPHFRVEIIVLTHETSRPDRHLTRTIDSFNALTDPVARAREAAFQAGLENQAEVDSRGQQEDPLQSDLAVFDALSALDEAGDEEVEEPTEPGPTYPETYVNLDQLSEGMQAAWRRLENSPEFQPRAWRAWYQPISRARASAPVRIHDEHIVRMDWLQLTPTGRFEPDPLPKPDYRLDGSVRLVQRQFLHAEIDLAWREPSEFGSGPAPSGPLRTEYIEPGGFLQHRLQQSRTIRAGRLEYFDSAWLGVLVRIERWEPASDGAAPET